MWLPVLDTTLITDKSFALCFGCLAISAEEDDADNPTKPVK